MAEAQVDRRAAVPRLVGHEALDAQSGPAPPELSHEVLVAEVEDLLLLWSLGEHLAEGREPRQYLAVERQRIVAPEHLRAPVSLARPKQNRPRRRHTVHGLVEVLPPDRQRLVRAIVGDEAPEHICRHRPMPAKAKVPSKSCPDPEGEGNPRSRWCAAPPALESSPAPRKGAAARLAVLLLQVQKARQRHLAIVGGCPSLYRAFMNSTMASSTSASSTSFADVSSAKPRKRSTASS